MLENDSDGDDCNRSIGAHSAGPLMTLRLNDEDGGGKKQEKGRMKRRGSFGGLGGALANLGIGGGGDDDRSVGGHSLGAMVFAADKNERAQRRPSLGEPARRLRLASTLATPALQPRLRDTQQPNAAP